MLGKLSVVVSIVLAWFICYGAYNHVIVTGIGDYLCHLD